MNDSIDPGTLFKLWNLESGVFMATDAGIEPKLGAVFHKPSWWEALAQPSRAQIIVGVRGTGKSTICQCLFDRLSSIAFTAYLANYGPEYNGKALPIKINKATQAWASNPNDEQETRNRLVVLIVQMITYKIIREFNTEELKSKLLKKELQQIDRYLKSASEQVETFEDKTELRKKVCNRITKATLNLKTTVNFPDIQSIDIKILKLKNPKTSTITEIDLQTIITIAKKLGYVAIYILVDEIDEYNNPGGGNIQKIENTTKLLNTLLTSQALLETPLLIFKIFMPEPVYHTLRRTSEMRQDRWPKPYMLAWQPDDIKAMLEKRLRQYTCANNDDVEIPPITSMTQFCDSNENFAKPIDDIIAEYAFRSPRHYIRLCGDIANLVAEKGTGQVPKITKQILDDVLLSFCKDICRELYDRYIEGASNTIIKYNKIEFTEDQIIDDNGGEAHKEKIQSILNIISVSSGLDRIEDATGSRFIVMDPRLIYLMRQNTEKPNSGLLR